MASSQDGDDSDPQKDILIQKLRNPRKGGTIHLEYLHVKSIPYFPKAGVNHLTLNNLWNITELPPLPRYLQTLSLDQMKGLKTLPDLPDTLYRLNVVETPLETIPVLPEWLQSCVLIATRLTSLEGIPPHLKTLICADTPGLKHLGPLPDTLEELDCSSTSLETLPSLPKGLLRLNCEQTDLRTLPMLPSSLQSIDATQSRIERLPPLPKSLKSLKINQTPLLELPPVPDSLNNLLCEQTRLRRYPHMLGTRLWTLHCDKDFFDDLYELPPYLESVSVYDYSETRYLHFKLGTDVQSVILEVNETRFKERCIERCLKIKEELLAEVWKPSRVAKLVEAGRWDIIETS